MKYALGNILNGAGGLNPDGLSLDLQFATDKTLTARKGPNPVLARASVGTFIGSNGLIQTASIDVARFDHDPNTLVCKGLLIEEQRTNLLNFSQTFATSGGSQNNWVDTNITRDGTLRTSPDGTSNALRITASAANGTVISSQSAGLSAIRAFSIFLRRVTGTGNIQYTLDNGSTWSTQAITASWVRYTFAATTAAQRVGIRITTSADAIEIWGAQIEAGAFTTSYIPTTTASVVRSADVCSITGANFTSFYNQPEFSLFCEAISASHASFPSYVSLDNGTANEQAALSGFPSPNIIVCYVIDNNVTQSNTSRNITLNQTNKMAAGFKQNSFQIALNNSLGTEDVIGTMPTATIFNIGRSWNGLNINGTITSIRYYKKRLSNAKLQTITA